MFVDSQRGATFEISLLSFPLYPIMNNIYHHEGNPSISDFECQTNLVTDAVAVQCKFEDVDKDSVAGKTLFFYNPTYPTYPTYPKLP